MACVWCEKGYSERLCKKKKSKDDMMVVLVVCKAGTEAQVLPCRIVGIVELWKLEEASVKVVMSSSDSKFYRE